jgi:hypothetical protein
MEVERCKGSMTATEEVYAASLAIFGLCNRFGYADAIVAMTGLGEHRRIIQAIKAWDSGKFSSRFLMITGDNPHERTAERFNVYRLQEPPFNLQHREGVIVDTDHGGNTKIQSEWVVQQSKRLAVSSAIIVTSSYHMVRAYLTVLKSSTDANVPIRLYPMLAEYNLDATSPEFNVPMWDLIGGEVERIIRYQAKGDVATLRELKEYLMWLHAPSFNIAAS